MRMEDPRDLETRFLALRYEIAGERMMLAALRFSLTLERCANFDPAQPRDEIGRWTSIGTSPEGTEEVGPDGSILVAGPFDWGSVDLRSRKGTKAAIRSLAMSARRTRNPPHSRLPVSRMEPQGSEVWRGRAVSIDSANQFADEALKSNVDRVMSVGSGITPASAIYANLDRATGREIVVDARGWNIGVRTTYGVAVFTIHDPAKLRGYRIHTAYPMNFD